MRGKTQNIFRRSVFFTAEFQDFSMDRFVQDHKKGKLLALRCHTLAVHFLHPVRKLVGLVAQCSPTLSYNRWSGSPPHASKTFVWSATFAPPSYVKALVCIDLLPRKWILICHILKSHQKYMSTVNRFNKNWWEKMHTNTAGNLTEW